MAHPLDMLSEKRPGDVIGAAIKVAKIATGEIEEDTKTDDGKDKAAQSLGRRGGKGPGRGAQVLELRYLFRVPRVRNRV